MKNKFICKYMKLARTLADDKVPCLSRGIGAVIVDLEQNIILGTGYNGAARKIPEQDSVEFLREYIYPQLTDKDREYLYNNNEALKNNYIDFMSFNSEDFANTFKGCQICPRRLVGAKSGERLDFCSCSHAERNAIFNSFRRPYNCAIFCWCGVPCVDCSIAIIQSGIKEVYCLNEDESKNKYNTWRSEWLFEKANIDLIKTNKEFID